MTIIETTARVDEHGNVTVRLPEPFRESGRPVRVILWTPEVPPPIPSPAEWADLIDRTAGSMPDLARPMQPPVPPAPEFG